MTRAFRAGEEGSGRSHKSLGLSLRVLAQGRCLGQGSPVLGSPHLPCFHFSRSQPVRSSCRDTHDATPGRTPIGCRVSREANQRHRAPRLQYFLWTPGDSASSQNMWMAVSHPRTLFLLLLSGALTLTETSAGECGVGREISAAWEEGEGFRTHPSAAPPPGT